MEGAEAQCQEAEGAITDDSGTTPTGAQTLQLLSSRPLSSPWETGKVRAWATACVSDVQVHVRCTAALLGALLQIMTSASCTLFIHGLAAELKEGRQPPSHLIFRRGWMSSSGMAAI